MRALKSIVRGCFAVQAAVLLLIVVGALMGGLRSHVGAYLAHSASAQAHHSGARMIAYGVAGALLAIGILFAAAWWTTRKPAPENRIWAILASVVNVGQGVLLLLASHLSRGRIASSLSDGLICIGLGAAGIAMFARSEPEAAVAAPMVERKSVAGDRTSAYTRHAVTVLSCIAQIAAIVIWSRWAYDHDLLRAHGLLWIALVTVASVLTTLIHECGHALIAWCFEMSLLSFKAGPFQWVKREGKWTFKLHMAGLLTPGGAVGAVSKDPDQPRWEEILMIAAGPLANLLIGVPAVYAVLHDDWPHYQQTWELVAFTGSFCLIAAILNFFPFMSEEGSYSDGARILQIVTKSPLEEYHRTMASIAATATTERRYRDLDVAAIQRAASLFPGEFRGLHLNLCVCHCYEDRSRFADASVALASAEAIYNNFSIDLPAPLHTVFVIGHAYLNRDAAAARLWWDRMEAKKNERRNVDYWLARTALLWIEGDAKGAEAAWFEADALAQALPKFGAYEFDRFRCFLLRQALNEPMAVAETASEPATLVSAPTVVSKDSKDGAAVVPPILPAWITPVAAPATAVMPDVAKPSDRTTPPPVAAKVPDYSDTASMFARLSSLTARSAEVSGTAESTQEVAATIAPAPEDAAVEPEPQSAADESTPLARIISVRSNTDALDGVQPAVSGSTANILPHVDHSMPDLLAKPIAPTPALPATWSARPSAPPLEGAPSVTPLPVDAWTSLPLAAPPDAVTAFSQLQVQTSVEPVSKGPSVPAAFARRPRVVGPMPEDPFAVLSTVEFSANEPLAASAPVPEQIQTPSAIAEAAAITHEPIAQEAVVALPQIAEPAKVSSTAKVSTEVSPRSTEAPPPPPSVPAVVEAPRFDPLAFIRAAALENLST